MKIHISEQRKTVSFLTRYQRSWHNGIPGMAEHLHFWLCNG